MKILFLGGIFPKEMEKEILAKSKGTVHNAANKLQWNFIDGLMDMEGLDLQVLAAQFLGTYPKDYEELFIKNHNFLYKNIVHCECVSFCNLWGYRNISRNNSLKSKIRRFALEETRNKAIIIYSPHTPFLQAAVYAKKQDPSIHICLIVPDLPQFMNLNEHKSIIYNKLKQIDIKLFKKNVIKVDSFVLLTEHMKNFLHVGDRPYTVIEGIVNATEMTSTCYIKHNEESQSVVYTGTLNKNFGVVNLVAAFHAIKNDYITLDICGRGDSEEIVKGYACKDKRIRFWGQLSNKEAVSLQKNATVLVNPRQNNEEFTKYSFPSKNMEYLLSGNPVIAYKLDGIPDEYDKYFFYVEDNTISALSAKIKEVLNLTKEERYKCGEQGRAFVIREKNNIKASLKIVNMIKATWGRCSNV